MHLPDDDDEPAGTRYQLGTALLEITFVVLSDSGAVLIDFDPPLQWATEPFGSHRRELAGIDARVLPFAVVKQGKTGFVPGVGRDEEPKDRADLAALLMLARISAPTVRSRPVPAPVGGERGCPRRTSRSAAA